MDAEVSYTVGDTVKVVFQSACPRNNVRRGGTFMTVEHQEEDTNTWTVVHSDDDWSTKYEWQRPMSFSPHSTATTSWTIPPSTRPGFYRIRHFGDYK